MRMRFVRRRNIHVILVLVLFYCLSNATPAKAQFWDTPPLPAVQVVAAPDGMTATVGPERIHISVCGASVIHFVSTPELHQKAAPSRPWMLEPKESCPGAKFQLSQTPEAAILATEALRIEFSLKRGNVQFRTLSGEALLRERDSVPRTYEPAELNGEATFHIEDRFAPDATEGFYGLGQHQSGVFNYRGATVPLAQNNTDVAIPLLVSTKGYALLWNTASLTHVDNRFPLELNLRALAGHSVDYYFIYGPEMDQLIHEYRNLTGHTPLLPKWAYGFFQSKTATFRRMNFLESRTVTARSTYRSIPSCRIGSGGK